MKELRLILLLTFCAVTQIGFGRVVEPNEILNTQVVIIGTIHSWHYESGEYGPEKLKEIILSVTPDVILNELPLSKVDRDGRPIKKYRLKPHSSGPESWAADTAAMKLGIKQIPFDRPDRDDYYIKTNYFKRQKKYNQELNKWFNKLYAEEPNSLDIKAVELLVEMNKAQSSIKRENLINPKTINSQFYDCIIRAKHSSSDIIPLILKKHSAPQSMIDESNFLRNVWLERNRIMADNIIKAAKEYQGKRMVVVTGSEHRYILHNLLKENPNIELKEYWEIKEEGTIDETNEVVHITSRKEWDEALAEGVYKSKSLEQDGFIHCSKWSQIIRVANHKFKGQEGLILLVIDSGKLKSEVKWEGNKGNLFPHIYGPLNLDAVKKVLDFRPGEDGTFELPMMN